MDDLPTPSIVRSQRTMDEGRLSTALQRAEAALARIERMMNEDRSQAQRDEQLRERVREAVVELDQIIRMAEA